MISIQDCGRFCKKYPSVALFNSFSSLESDDKLSDQPTRSLKLYLTIVPTFTLFVFKYTKKNLQRILKTVLKARVFTTYEKSQDKSLKACSQDVYYNRSYKNCYKFYQQYEDYFANTGAKSTNQIPFTVFFL